MNMVDLADGALWTREQSVFVVHQSDCREKRGVSEAKESPERGEEGQSGKAT